MCKDETVQRAEVEISSVQIGNLQSKIVQDKEHFCASMKCSRQMCYLQGASLSSTTADISQSCSHSVSVNFFE